MLGQDTIFPGMYTLMTLATLELGAPVTTVRGETRLKTGTDFAAPVAKKTKNNNNKKIRIYMQCVLF